MQNCGGGKSVWNFRLSLSHRMGTIGLSCVAQAAQVCAYAETNKTSIYIHGSNP